MTSPPTSPPVLLTVEDGVATISLNRPLSMNSLDVDCKVLLRDIVLSVADDRAIRCVVLTGSGKAFCVGQDLKEHAQMLRAEHTDHNSKPVFSTVSEHYNPIVEALATMAKPVIASVNGVAAGAGASLAFACDLRIVADSAGFNLAFAQIGLSCDTGASWTLPRLVGYAKALELLYFPRTIDAAEALSLGLANQVVAAGDLAVTVGGLARRLADGPTLALGSIRRSVAYAAQHSFVDSLDFESQQMAATGASSDHSQAVDAFLAKQTPVFKGA